MFQGAMVKVMCRLPLAAAVAVVAVFGAAGGTAYANAPWSATEFTPELSVESTTDKAGAHPEELTIRMNRPPNVCIPPYREGPTQWPVQQQFCEEASVQQNLKDWTINLPPGLLADVNATAALCSPEWSEGIGYEEPGWLCPPESKVGEVLMWDRECFRDIDSWRGRDVDQCLVLDGISGGGSGPWAAPILGEVYNGVAEAGEQGHLYVIAGPGLFLEEGDSDSPGSYAPFTLIDASVRVRTDDVANWGIDSIAKDIPDAVPYSPGQQPFPVAVYDTAITLHGQTGSDRNHPLISNPTSCQPRDVSSIFTGYATNSHYGEFQESMPGSGIGKEVAGSVPYQVTGCDELRFEPKVEVALDPPLPQEQAGITSTLTQAVGEQTLKRVDVEIPKSFKVNLENTLAQCTQEQASARSCPDAAQIGEVIAESNLLPETGELAGPLRGKVFVGETTATDIKLYILLHGFVEATLQGSITMNADGSSQATFELPEIPQQKVTLKLFGGADKALVTTPKHCGTHTFGVAFTSHNGAVSRRGVPVDVSCTDPSFEVRMGSRRPRAHPTVTLIAKSAGLDGASFDLSRFLRVGSRGRLLKTSKRYGTLTLSGDYGTRELKVKLRKKGSLGSLAFTVTEGGKQITTLSTFDTKLAGRSKKGLSKRERRRFGRRTTRMSLAGLPEGTTQIVLELLGSRDAILRNPASCKRGTKRTRLGFLAHLRTTNGASHALKRTVAMRCRVGRKSRGR